jgi:Peptidase C13 family
MRACLLLLLASVSLPAANYFVTVAGLGGAPEYETQFAKWAQDIERELKAEPDAQVITLSGAAATRQKIEQTLSKLAAEMKASDTLALFLIGHGTFDGADYKINLPGPDMTAAELAKVLNRIPSSHQLIVNMTSCSGASVAALAKKDRVVITATKSGTEKNAPVFARYWIDALHDPGADTDKNGSVSALEAFRYADRKTAAYFESEKLLATEHASMTDTASTTAVRDPKPENGQGLAAASFILIRQHGEGGKTLSQEKQRLVTKKEELEAKIDRLKYQKAAMEESEYKQQLTALLLELARTQAEIDR